MTKKLKQQRAAEYPWKKWFSRKTTRLRRGRDFSCQVHGMASQIRCKASKRKFRVSLSIDGDEILLTMQGAI